MAKVRSSCGRDFAIRQTCVDKMVGNRRVDFKLPRRLKNPQVTESACIPDFCAWRRNLRVTDIHRYVVCPDRHLTGDSRSLDGEVGSGRAVRSIFPEVNYRRKENVLQILTKLVFALCKCSDGKKKTGAH